MSVAPCWICFPRLVPASGQLSPSVPSFASDCERFPGKVQSVLSADDITIAGNPLILHATNLIKRTVLLSLHYEVLSLSLAVRQGCSVRG